MRYGSLALGSVLIFTTAMVIAGCGSSSGGSAGSSGTAGSSGSSSSVGSAGKSGSSATSAAGSSAAGSSGKGGQAGSTSSGTGAVTSLDGTKTLGSLSKDEGTKLCNDAIAYFGRAIPWSTVCRWTGLTYAISSSAPTVPELQAACTKPENTCLGSPSSSATYAQSCSTIPSTCKATVADYSACMADLATSFIPAVAKIPACAAITRDDITAVYDVEAQGDSYPLPKSCEPLDKCSGLSSPNPIYYTGPSEGTGGSGGAAGSSGTGGATSTGGKSTAGGSTATTGTGGKGGVSSGGTSSGGRSGTGGSTGGSTTSIPSSGGPCDIYEAAKTPCVGAYSLVRALYKSYSGNLYQVRRTSDKSVKDIPVLAAGGFADSSVQDAFCTDACTISILYDQSPQKNDLPITGPVFWLKSGGTESDAKAAKIKVGGHTVYGLKVVGGKGNGYRNGKPKGTAVKDEAEAMYEVASATDYNTWCCFDFGNAETTGNADGAGTMETIYWGANKQFGQGAGNGPWLMSDLEAGVFASDQKVSNDATPMVYPAFVTLMMKGFSGNRFGLKAGDAQTGTLVNRWDGKRPAGYSPMKKQGAIVLGIGGDGSPSGAGTWFEGAITFGCPDDPAVDEAIQANIVAAGYGK